MSKRRATIIEFVCLLWLPAVLITILLIDVLK